MPRACRALALPEQLDARRRHLAHERARPVAVAEDVDAPAVGLPAPAALDVLDRDVIDESQLTVENVKYKDAGWRKDLKNVKIELVFDRRNGYLLRAFISVPSANDAITTQSLKEMLLRRLQNAGVLPQPTSLRKASVLANTSVPDVRMPKYEHNARQLSSRFITDTSHAQSYNRKKRDFYRGVKRSSSHASYVPRSKRDDDDDTQLSSGLIRERMSLL